ncbi:hypothetical protein AAVH_15865 [Aphelenchoides avenae]|nr:hypothetical protein AAVH_15865 [Aphelenchus avenae]
MGSALGTPKANAMSKQAYKVRQQVLPAESLLDVFNYVDRRTLDGANVVSYAYNTAAQQASPLRRVKNAHLFLNPRDQTFHVTVYFKRAYVDMTKGRIYNERNALEMVADDMEEAVGIFFRFLRFCNVTGSIRLYHLRIQQLFVDQLKEVAMHFLCEGYNLELNDVTLADDVNTFDLLLAFPSFRKLNYNTYDFLKQSVGNGDELLKAVAARAAFYLFADWPLDGSEFSEAAVLDYLFGDYKDDGEVRELEIDLPTFSKKLLINLVRACRERRSELKIDLKIETFDDLDVDELANGLKPPSDSGVPCVWRFRFDDLPELNIQYKPSYRPIDDDWETAELHCWGTIRGSARGH